jgi:hypothetical protein
MTYKHLTGNMLAHNGSCLKQKLAAAGKASKGFVRAHFHVAYQGFICLY